MSNISLDNIVKDKRSIKYTKKGLSIMESKFKAAVKEFDKLYAKGVEILAFEDKVDPLRSLEKDVDKLVLKIEGFYTTLTNQELPEGIQEKYDEFKTMQDKLVIRLKSKISESVVVKVVVTCSESVAEQVVTCAENVAITTTSVVSATLSSSTAVTSPLCTATTPTQSRQTPLSHTAQPFSMIGNTYPYSQSINQLYQSPRYAPVNQSYASQSGTYLQQSEVTEGLQTQPSRSEIDNLSFGQITPNNLMLSRLPIPEPGKFNGDPLRFSMWINSFNALINRAGIPVGERLYHLEKYLDGAALAAVHELFMIPDCTYELAISTLTKRFGNPVLVADAFKHKLESWPMMEFYDPVKLIAYSDYLAQVAVAKKSYAFLNILDYPSELNKLEVKLPEELQRSWNREKRKIMRVAPYPPTFSNFCDFVRDEAEAAINPLTAMHPKKEDKRANTVKPRTSKPIQSHNYHVVSANQTYKDAPKQIQCPYCRGQHKLQDCKHITEINLEARKKFVQVNHLCFACLQPGHSSRFCRKRLPCTKCTYKHPDILHDSSMQKKPESEKNVHSPAPTNTPVSSANFMTGTDQGNASSMIVPVRLYSKSQPANKVLVYAMLDTQSDSSFILDSTLQDLNVQGNPTQLCLSTLGCINQIVDCSRITNLAIMGVSEDAEVELPALYSRSSLPANVNHIPTPMMVSRFNHLKQLEEKLMPITKAPIALLIGYNCPGALCPIDTIPAPSPSEPYGVKTLLGWSVVGVMQSDNSDRTYSHTTITYPVQCSSHLAQSAIVLKTTVKEIITPQHLVNMLDRELNIEPLPLSNKKCSIDDLHFLETMKKGIEHKESRYYMPLPFRSDDLVMPDSYPLANIRLNHLKKKLVSDNTLYIDYCQFMNNIISSGYAEKVDETTQVKGKTCFLPHHVVYHPHKKKICVVFDSSAKFHGVSLNDKLLSGPDMNSSIVSVLCRFRKEPIAVVCDVEQMFFQFRVKEEHRNFLSFLWWEDGKLDSKPSVYRMTSHVFGATSSPSCAMFGLKQLTVEYKERYSEEVKYCVNNCFYVDDALLSMPSTGSMVKLTQELRELLSHASLKLHKFVTNSAEVAESISAEMPSTADVPGSCVVERTLGVQWCISNDCFQFRIELQSKPFTRRGLLSIINSIYDPLGFISPFVLKGKKILQLACTDKVDWDDNLPEEYRALFEEWLLSLLELDQVSVCRPFKPLSFNKIKSVELHSFSDASTQGIGQCTYLRVMDEEDRVHCSLVLGKSKVIPSKPVTIPRLELIAATLSARIGSAMREDLDYSMIKEFYWTDSKVVLAYIVNTSKRFHLFVTNRVQFIRNNTDPNDWFYVPTAENPADIASRGIKYSDATARDLWFKGPKFLYDTHISTETPDTRILHSDPEVKVSVLACSVSVEELNLDAFVQHSSMSWKTLVKVMAWCKRFIGNVRSKISSTFSHVSDKTLSVEEIESSKLAIYRLVQAVYFRKELKALHSSKGQVCNSSAVFKLNPFIDKCGTLRVGGRLANVESMEFNVKHPILLPAPKVSKVSRLVIEFYHQRVQHQGRSFTLAAVRNEGLWILGGSSAVTTVIHNCYECKRLYGKVQAQIMADLPSDRVEPTPPFTYTGVDLFGPIYVKERRKELPRYGVVFVCMACKAIHLEVVNSLTTDAFINCLRRFMSLRGNMRVLRSDRGTNFIGAEKELRLAASELDESKVSEFLQSKSCDYVQFKPHVPYASHFGGIWERQIRTVRRILASLLREHSRQLDDEGLRTLLYEVTALINSRPLTVEDLSDPNSLVPISPNMLLTLKSKIALPPPGNFVRDDLYSRKVWRRVQYITNQFWSKWQKQYLQCLQPRQKWQKVHRSASINDIVLLKEEQLPRGQWPLCRVVEVYKSSDERVRSVKLLVGEREKGSSKRRFLERPVHKLVLLNPSD